MLFGFVARFDGVDLYYESEDTYDMAQNLIETPLEGYSDVFVHEASSTFSRDNVLSNPLGQSHVSPMCSHVGVGHKDDIINVLRGDVDTFKSLSYFGGYGSFLDTYCIYLANMLRKSCGTLSLIYLLIFLWHWLC